MYVRFKILTVKPILGERALLIEATHEIDPLTVKPENIRITKPGDPIEELLWNNLEINGKTIKLFLLDEPRINERYIVRIKNLKNIIDDKLETNYSQSVEFLSFTRSEISFIKPTMHSIVPELMIEIDEHVLENQRMGANQFEYQLSSDPFFISSIIASQLSQEKQIAFNIKVGGQIFIRCRAHYLNHETTHYSDWISTTCTIGDSNANAIAPEFDAPKYQLTLEVIDKPVNNAVDQSFAYVFDTEAITSVGSVTVIAKPMDGRTASVLINSYEIMLNNMLVINTQESIPKNCLVTVRLKDVRSDIRVLEDYTDKFYSVLEPCYGDIKDISGLLELDLDPEIVYYHLVEASKLADYYADIKLTGIYKNRPYYNKVDYAKDFEKAMFVKYYTANQVLSQIRSGLAYSASLGGKLGEIEYTPKGALPDLTSVLKGLLAEADKWKLALQGYKDHPADSKSAVKAKKCLPHNHIRGWR